MNAEYTALLSEGVKLLVTVAAAWGSVKASLNGARKDIAEIKVDVKGIVAEQAKQATRVAILEDREQRDHTAA